MPMPVQRKVVTSQYTRNIDTHASQQKIAFKLITKLQYNNSNAMWNAIPSADMLRDKLRVLLDRETVS